jgi:hypothetical protein
MIPKNESPPLYIALTCDTVSDYFDSQLWSGEAPVPLCWRGVEEGCTAMVEAISTLRDSRGRIPVFTWFVPVDNFMETRFGDCAYLLDRFDSIWKNFRLKGDEIAWHVYQHRSGTDPWYPEPKADLWRSGLGRCHNRLNEIGTSVQTTRLGGTYCSNEIMCILEKLGIMCDMSALPGRVRKEGFLNLDWEITPESPYFPSIEDYRIPGAPNVGVLEVPLSMVSVKAPYDERPFKRYVDPSFYHHILWPGLEALLNEMPEYLALIVHPSAVLDDIILEEHGLLSFSLEEFWRNIECIVEHCNRLGREFEFVTVAELREIFERRQGASCP